MDQENYTTEYDNLVQTRELQMLKSMLPFVGHAQQMPLAILIQSMEIKNTMRVFRDSEKTLSAFSLENGTDKRTAMLQTFKRFCSPQEQETIDTILNIMCVMDCKEETLGRFFAE